MMMSKEGQTNSTISQFGPGSNCQNTNSGAIWKEMTGVQGDAVFGSNQGL